MDYIKIGKFIFERRKEKKLTQAKLAEMLFVSEKTVSKWENGNGLPDTMLLPKLCEVLEVNINELLSGEKLDSSAYQQNAENNILSLLNQRRDGINKIILSAIAGFIAISVLVVCVLLVAYIEMAQGLKAFLITFGIIITILSLGIACVMDKSAGSFECKICKHRFVPTFSAYVAGAHTLTTRYLKCPNCGKNSYCKHRLTK